VGLEWRDTTVHPPKPRISLTAQERGSAIEIYFLLRK
jgi:hypothetical protein